MKVDNFSMSFDMEGDAFSEANRQSETARILMDTIKKIKDGHKDGLVIDVNGNAVGGWFLELVEEDE